MKWLLLGIFVAGALASAACGGGDSKTTPATALATSPLGGSATKVPEAVSPAPNATSTAGTTAAASPATATAPPSPIATAAATAAPPTPQPVATAPPAPTSAPPPPAVTSVTVTAENLAFDRAVIRVKAGTSLTATFVNKDVGVDHNLSFSLPGLGHPTCLGPCTTSQTFTATQAGTFSFFCTLHAEMFGDFIVD